MTKKQIFILTMAFLFGLVLSRMVSAQEISGPATVPVNRLSTFEITGVEQADWGLVSASDGCDLSVDSGTLKVYVVPYKPGTVFLHAAVIVDGKPVLSRFSFEAVGDVQPDPDPGPEPKPDPKPEPVTLTDYVKSNWPKSLSAQQVQILGKAFSSTAQNLDAKRIRTIDSAYNSVRMTTTQYFKGREDVTKFLAGITERTKGQDTVQLSASYKEIAEALSAINVTNTARQAVADYSKQPAGYCPQCISTKP